MTNIIKHTKTALLCVAFALVPYAADAQTDGGAPDASRYDYPRVHDEGGDAWVCAMRPSSSGDADTITVVSALAIASTLVARRRRA